MSRMLTNGPVFHNGHGATAEDRFLHYKRELHQQLIAGMDLSAIGAMDEAELRVEVRQAAESLCRNSSDLLNLSERERLVSEVLDETFGLGPLEPLIRDPTITDILINGPKTIYVERHGRLTRSEVVFNDERHLLQIVQRIVSRVGRRVDETMPMVDARLQDGSRVNAIIPPLALDGTLVSIRRFGAQPLLFDDLIAKRSITQEMVDFLSACIRARINILISGGTGSGKTTLLNALSGFIPADERVATIEDAAELRLQQPHVVRMETRPREHRGGGRGHDSRPGQERAPDAPRPGHHRRVPRPRGARHAPGDEHRPRRQPDDDPRQRHPRRDQPPRDDGGDGGLRPADLDHPAPDLLGDPDRRPGGPALRRCPQDRQDLGNRRHGGRYHQHARHLCLQADRRR